MEAKLPFREALALEREALLDEVRAERAKQTADIPERALVWLALAPVWTVALAEACGFPTDGAKVEETLKRIHAEGLCEFSPVPPEMEVISGEAEMRPDLGARRFWMADSTRADVLQRVIREPGQGVRYLREEMQFISESIQNAQSAGVPVPDTVARWAMLAARAKSTQGVAELLDGRVEDLLDVGQSGEALRWVEAARRLEELLGGDLTAAVERAGRRLELFHRRKDDERHLRHFLERRGQIDAFNELIDGPDDLWALHYIGAGGVGKTMLMRYITARLAPERKASAARIDFDYLNPDYPSRAPGLLLAQLAEELRLHDEKGAAARLFASFDRRVLRLHERLGGSFAGARTALATTQDPEFDELIETFAKAAASLPQPVILLLDTCEELAKIRPDGTAPENVQATFDILERLHKRLPSARVVFCGRRPLASGGHGWNDPDVPQPRREYLRLHRIVGFTRQEAEHYLIDKAKVPQHLVEPIIERCPHQADPVTRTHDQQMLTRLGLPRRGEKTPPRTTEVHYSPFDLALYAAWAREDPSLTPEMIRAADADQYVNMRIVGRIRHPALRELLPAVALLGRFDRDTLRAASDADPGSFDQVFQELSNQEWIDRQPARFLEVERGLRPRLLAYYRRSNVSEMEAARRRAVAYLERITTEWELARLDISHFDAALRLLEPEPERAAAWWDAVEARFAREQAYDWVRRLTERLLAEEGSAAPRDPSDPEASPESRLRAAVLATYAAALIHTAPQMDTDAIWAEVARKADRYPTPEGANRLRLRAMVGRIAATRYTDRAPIEAHVKALWQALTELKIGDLDDQLAASSVAAVEAVLEHAERSRDRRSLPDPTPVLHLADALAQDERTPELQAFARTLVGRTFALHGRRPEALKWFERALQLQPQSGPTPQRWLDWRAPDDVVARVRLEFTRTAYPAVLPPSAVLSKAGDRGPDPVTIDADRLGAAILRLRGALRPLQARELKGLARRVRDITPNEPRCNAHAAFPPLFGAVAEAMAAGGQVDAALDLLQEQSRMAEKTAVAFDTVQAADRATLRIVRRMRLRDEGWGLGSDLLQSPDLKDQALLWTLEGLDGPKSRVRLSSDIPSKTPDEETRLAWHHARWRSTYALRPEMGQTAVTWAADALPADPPPAGATFAALSSFLDSLEANVLSEQLELSRPFPALTSDHMIDPSQWWQEHPDQPVEALALMLRAAVLAADGPAPIRMPQELPQRVGVRQAAEIALDEGELLALRLPERAIPLLSQARDWFAAAGDPVGATLAGICAALACARLGRLEELRTALARVREDHTACQADAALPPWERLEAAAERPETEGLDNLAPRSWRPWLVRLIACMVREKDAGGPGERFQQLVAWLRSNYGATTEGEIALPAELDGWLAMEVEEKPWRPPAPAPEPTPQPPIAPAERWEEAQPRGCLSLGVDLGVLFDILIILLGLGMGALILAGGYWLYRYLLQAVYPGEVGALSAVISYILLLAAILYGLPKAYRYIQAYFVSRPDITLVIAPVSEGPRRPSLRDPTDVLMTLQRRTPVPWPFRWPPYTWRSAEPIENQRTIPGIVPYRQAARALPPGLKLRRELRHLEDMLRSRSAVVELRIDQPLNWVCWEGIISLARKEITSPLDIPFRFHRTVPGARTRQPTRWGAISHVLSLIGNLTQEEMTQQGWKQLIQDQHFNYNSLYAEEFLFGRPVEPTPHVLHLVGTPMETASGVRLHVSGGEYYAQKSSSVGRGELLRVEDLAKRFPELALCVLQATPIETGERTDADREQAAYLRLFAADLFVQGVPAIVTIPPLPPSAGAAVLNQIAAALRGRQQGTRALLKAIATAQDAIMDLSEADPEAKLEAALDLCLYAADARTDS
jgi:hypothetical protein